MYSPSKAILKLNRNAGVHFVTLIAGNWRASNYSQNISVFLAEETILSSSFFEAHFFPFSHFYD